MSDKSDKYNWKELGITNWKRDLRIVLNHEWNDIPVRGLGAVEAAKRIFWHHRLELSSEEIEFLESIR